ncbi:hypothetical protein [Geomicrobium sp. JCM 19039]|nr:hypothetical protein [Geomicrobium sp. JCM 19039]
MNIRKHLIAGSHSPIALAKNTYFLELIIVCCQKLRKKTPQAKACGVTFQ